MTKTLKQLIITVYSVAGISVIANLIATNTLATQGVIVDELYAQTQQLQEENRLLNYQINTLANLEILTTKAQYLGFQSTKTVVIIPDSSSVAQLPLSLSYE